MNKFLSLLVLGMATMAAAGVVNVGVGVGVRTGIGGVQRSDGQRIQEMSVETLKRQKFLLDILLQVQQPLQQRELISLDNGGLITDQQRYIGGIDNEMQRVINLDSQRRLLDQRQVYSVREEQHVRQLQGLYQLLVRAQDWETLQSNVVYLRRNINPVLLVNVLTLVVRDRPDTQMLIMPAIQEVLPELYLDQQVVERVQRMDVQQIQQQTVAPNLMDLIGMGRGISQRQSITPLMLHILDRTQLWMPWRQLRMQMTRSKNSGVGVGVGVGVQRQQILDKRVVVPITSDLNEQGMSLLTQDIGMRDFVQNLINDLSLQEQQDTSNMQRGGINQRTGWLQTDNVQQQIMQGRRGPWQRDLNDNDNLVDIDEDDEDTNTGRMLFTNRRRQGQQTDMDDELLGNQRVRFMNVLRGQSNRMTDDTDQLVRVGLQRENGWGLQSGLMDRNVDWRLGGRGGSSRMSNVGVDIDNLPTVDINSQRLLHVNRRRLNSIAQQQQQMEQQQLGNSRQRFMGIIRGDRLGEGRRVNVNSDENVRTNEQQRSILGNWMDLSILQGGKRQQQQQQQQQQEEQRGVWRNSLNEDEIERQQLQMQGQRIDMDTISGLKSVPRDSPRLVHINRRRLNQQQQQIQLQQQDEQQQQRLVHQRVGGIGESRNVDEDTITSADILQLIRSDNRLNELSDDAILQMLERSRERRRQRKEQRGVDVDAVVVDDDDEDDVMQQQQQQQQSRNSIQQNGRRQRRSINIQQQMRLLQAGLRRNEILLHTLQQLVARLNQERISLGQTQDIDELTNINQLQRIGNTNTLRQNTIEGRYAMRLNEMRLDGRRQRALLQQVNDIEQRLQWVIDQQIGRQLGLGQGQQGQGQQLNIDNQLLVDGIIGDVLMGNLGQVGILRILRELLQTNEQQIVGDDIDRLGLGGVSLSDPVVQHILRRIVRIVEQQREQILGAYSIEELQMNGVTINDVRVDKLRTHIENVDMDLTNLLQEPQREQLGQRRSLIVGTQRRLNNKEFNIDMDINSMRQQDVIIRILLGPSTDALGRQVSLEQSRRNFIVLDSLITRLQTGRNRIQRNSNQINWTTRDVTPYSEIYRRVMMALRGEMQDDLTELVGENGRFPQRLLLPRGRVEGLPMQLLVVVSPVLEENQLSIEEQQQQTIGGGIGIGSVNLDRRPLGYPLDRSISNTRGFLELPNVSLTQALIFQDN